MNADASGSGADETTRRPRNRTVIVTVSVVIGVAVLLAVVAGIAALVPDGAGGPSDPQAGSGPRPSSDDPTSSFAAHGYIRDDISTIAGSDCPVFPRDNVWHAVVAGDDVPILGPDDPRSRMLAAANGPVRAPFGPDKGAGLNIVPSPRSDPTTIRVASNWLAPWNHHNAQATDADRAGLNGPVPWLSIEILAPPPAELRWANMSLDPDTDNHMYIVDTSKCLSSEFIGFNGLLMRATGELRANLVSQFDLRSNNRRQSRTWGEGPCPEVPTNLVFDPGCDNSVVKRSTARGGSGLSGVGGLIRAAELDSPFGIDHAIAAVLPKNMIAGTDPAWPATVTDGTGTADTFPDAPAGAEPIPMGARLRLRSDFELGCSRAECPQATAIVTALKRHGAIVIDSMGPVEKVEGAAMHLGGEMSQRWDPEDLRRIASPADPSHRMRVSDFEIVDAQDMRALPEAEPQDDGWLQIE